MAADPEILCFNVGSSSLKFALYQMGTGEPLLARGAVEGIGESQSRCWVQHPGGQRVEETCRVSTHGDATARAFATLASERIPGPTGVGHRIVHGGARFVKPQRVDPSVLAELRRLIPLAPLHLPSELAVIQAVMEKFPAVPQVVCFDTAFHRASPELSQRFPLARKLWDEGV